MNRAVHPPRRIWPLPTFQHLLPQSSTPPLRGLLCAFPLISGSIPAFPTHAAHGALQECFTPSTRDFAAEAGLPIRPTLEARGISYGRAWPPLLFAQSSLYTLTFLPDR